MKKIIKSLLSLIIVVCLIFGTAPFAIFDVFNFTILPNIFAPNVFAANYSGKCGENLTWELDTSLGLLAISGKGDMTNWSSNYESSPWYEYRSSVKKIVINKSVTSLGDGAFFNCNNLTTVTVSASVKRIGVGAFFSCTSLKTITIPNSVTTIEDGAFDSCSSLTKIVLPDSVTNIGKGLFFECTNLTEATLSKSIKKISKTMFGNCQKLKKIIIPNSVKNIESSAFSGCTNLTNITIPASVTTIGECSFCGCTSLKNVYYSGTKAQWNKISFGSHNDYLNNSTLHFAEEVTQVQSKPITTKPATKPTTTKPITKEDTTAFNSTVSSAAPTQAPSTTIAEDKNTEFFITESEVSESVSNYFEPFYEDETTEFKTDSSEHFANDVLQNRFNEELFDNSNSNTNTDTQFEWWYWFVISAVVSFIAGVLLIVFYRKKQ